MNYEKTRREFYEQELHAMSKQLSEILDSGHQVEISQSRSGLKVYSVKKKHQIVRRGRIDSV